MKILFWNVLLGGEERLGAIADVLAREEPDAVALAEATPASVDALAQALRMESALVESNHPYPRAHGLCVAWLAPRIAEQRGHRLPELAKGLLEIRLDRVALYATHLASRHEEADHPRVREVEAILDAVAEGPKLLAGDLNALAPGDDVGSPPPGVQPRRDALAGAPRETLRPLLERGWIDCYRAVHPGSPGFTYPATAPWLRLDYLFASPELAPRVRDAGVVEAGDASDHLPVWVALA